MSVAETLMASNEVKIANDLGPERTSPAPATNKRKTRHPLVRWMLMLVRRSHLYFGLLLAPWALLYGVTAYLFNHPSHFSNISFEYLSSESLPTPWLTKEWNATDRSQKIVDELNRRFFDTNEPIQISTQKNPRFEGSYINATFEHGKRVYNVSLPLDGNRSGSIRSNPKRIEPVVETAKAFFDVSAIQKERSVEPNKRSNQSASKPVPESLAEKGADLADARPRSNLPLYLESDLERNLKLQIIEAVKKHATKLEVAPESIRITSIPKLIFQAEDGKRKWECRHDPAVGSLTTKEVNTVEASDFTWRRFLLRLHTAHGYPAEGGPRWYWAVVVDVMAFVMVFWGVSGIVMWWQIKATRRWGSVAMFASLALATWLGVSMYFGMQ